MLVDFIFKNSYSFKDENVFSMEKDSGNEFHDINTFECGFKKIELLKSSIIYGANGSGKSNFIKSIKGMKNLILYSVIPLGAMNDIKSFKFIEGYTDPTKYEVTIIIDAIKYRYGFEVENNEVSKEWLYRTVQKESCLFFRESSNFEDIKLYSTFKKEESIKNKVSKTSLFLTICKMFNNEIADKIWTWFDELEILTIQEQNNAAKTFEILEKKPIIKNSILDYLKKADIGIEDFNYEFESSKSDAGVLESLKSELVKNIKVGFVTQKISNFNTKHKLYDYDGNELDKTIEIPFEEYQSDGTKKLFALLGPIFNVLDKGGVLFIDEIDSRLHCAIVRFVLDMFNSIDLNKNNAQLICNTHDVLLLEENIRRDQIWFVDKNNKGISELYSLSDFNGIRKDNNLLKRYLLGVFGAIPFKNLNIDGE
ncbi:ATP-binding protein [Clostridium perfringens]|uniref:AAA family ATPase n=2 Tax=Clostridium perfringens TaxID=1502 RepID=UPI000DA26D21|nr:ATP-binding protein [Clostridium perfringens]EGT4141825.1 ATP-binding protein [Clostridium perfringens]EHK2349788.1 ATP-binding protein [Clostridium perfringens]MCX0394917.1 ATP-binding protein [Clostridium perfringens]MDH5082261.1 hypothetical protein [Clostridium perfringens]MDK0803369.1 ATP-binding protein [Clostridium perfringens]